MTIQQLMPWIGGPTTYEAAFSPLICPIDESVGNQISPPVTITGIPTMTVIATRSQVERRTARFRLRTPSALTLVAMSVAIAPGRY